MPGVGTQIGQLSWSEILTKLGRRPKRAFQAFKEALVVMPQTDLLAFALNLGDRIYLVERFLRLPALNAAIAINYNTDFEILGTGASTDDVTFDAEGGIKMETDASANQQVILLPHLDSGQTAWTAITWGSDQEVWFETSIKTAAALADVTWAGLKLTNTPTVATDANQAFFRWEGTGTIKCVVSVGGTDVEHDSGVTPAVSSVYRLKILVDSNRIPYFYINGVLVATGAALTDATDFIPYIGVQGNAKAISVRYLAMSRNAA